MSRSLRSAPRTDGNDEPDPDDPIRFLKADHSLRRLEMLARDDFSGLGVENVPPFRSDLGVHEPQERFRDGVEITGEPVHAAGRVVRRASEQQELLHGRSPCWIQMPQGNTWIMIAWQVSISDHGRKRAFLCRLCHEQLRSSVPRASGRKVESLIGSIECSFRQAAHRSAILVSSRVARVTPPSCLDDAPLRASSEDQPSRVSSASSSIPNPLRPT